MITFLVLQGPRVQMERMFSHRRASRCTRQPYTSRQLYIPTRRHEWSLPSHPRRPILDLQPSVLLCHLRQRSRKAGARPVPLVRLPGQPRGSAGRPVRRLRQRHGQRRRSRGRLLPRLRRTLRCTPEPLRGAAEAATARLRHPHERRRRRRPLRVVHLTVPIGWRFSRVTI